MGRICYFNYFSAHSNSFVLNHSQKEMPQILIFFLVQDLILLPSAAASILIQIEKFRETGAQALQWEERQVGHANVNLDIDIFVISELKWLKFGLQAHFFKVFGYAKFQLSIFFTLRVMKLLVEVFSDFH